ncbi:MAG TPA: COX15/CtaA family protein [Chitinophagaceae bacterium]|nr:COX15/CtaA family protein [Chitinophagaceae bacterium]
MGTEKKNRIISNWLFIGVAMLVVQVLLGGVTRLTGSGLSITEWSPIMGAVPPMNEAEWLKAFEGYQKIAQYKYINNHFTLGDFKFIFFWEWLHRLWARFMGFVFLIPFLYFLLKKYFERWMITPLIMLFVLGGMQGLIGWIMVSTGLNDENVYVTHFSLAVHFISAMILIAYTLLFALSLRVQQERRLHNNNLRTFAIWITVIINVQLVYGAFMAGLKAANTAPTWPTINGDIVPANVFSSDMLHNIFYNPIAVQFIHRILAYLILVLVIAWWLKAKKEKSSAAFTKVKNWPLIFVAAQVLLGILAVLSSTKIVAGNFGIFEWLAELHQLVGMLLLLAMLRVIYYLKGGIN